MAWIKVDDQMVDHPKIEPLSDAAFRWLHKGLSYANRFLTNGTLPDHFLGKVPDVIRQELVDARVWEERRGRVAIHDYAEYQLTRDQVVTQRFSTRRRQELFRNQALRERIRQRDHDRCRYCGLDVAWTDRRGAHGGTYDHVNPDGDNTFDNVVVACRGCNSRKHCRTPEQAGMVLLQPGTKSDLNHESDLYATPTRPVPAGTVPPVVPQGGRAQKRRRPRQSPMADPLSVQQALETRRRRREMAADGMSAEAIEAVLDREYQERKAAS